MRRGHQLTLFAITDLADETSKKIAQEEVKPMKRAVSPEYEVVADELREEGRIEGREEARTEAALMLRKCGIDPLIIEKCTGVDAENLDKLAKEQEQKKGQSKGFEL